MYHQGAVLYVEHHKHLCCPHVLQGIQMTTKKRLCSIKGITEAKVDKIKVHEKMSTTQNVYVLLYLQEATTKLLVQYIKNFVALKALLYIQQDAGFLTALEYSFKRKQVFRISTGSSELE